MKPVMASDVFGEMMQTATNEEAGKGWEGRGRIREQQLDVFGLESSDFYKEKPGLQQSMHFISHVMNGFILPVHFCMAKCWGQRVVVMNTVRHVQKQFFISTLQPQGVDFHGKFVFEFFAVCIFLVFPSVSLCACLNLRHHTIFFLQSQYIMGYVVLRLCKQCNQPYTSVSGM